MERKYLVGLDIGSSSVKASLVNVESGNCDASAFFPETEAPILSVHTGWAEQEPQMWWENMKMALAHVMSKAEVSSTDIVAIGISYQMHGLVCIDKDLKPLRPAIIWCDSRAVPYGEQAFRDIGEEKCLTQIGRAPV